jgi:hypothetical protein
MDKIKLLRRASILTFEGKELMGRHRRGWFSQILEDAEKRIKNWK